MSAASSTRGDMTTVEISVLILSCVGLNPIICFTHEAFSDETCANTTPISEVGGWVSIGTRRCAASSDTASSVTLYELTVWSGVPTASSLREECKCLFAIWA